MFTTGTAAEIQIINKIKNKKFDVNSKIIQFLIEKYQFLKNTGPNLISDIKKI